ncbi:MAG: tetratricopeptide repeat protein [Flammeovirgaceae bacterium]
MSSVKKHHFIQAIIVSLLLFANTSRIFSQQKQGFVFTFPIAEVVAEEGKPTRLMLNFGRTDGITEKSAGHVLGLYDKNEPGRNVELGAVKLTKLEDAYCELQTTLKQNAQVFKGDVVRLQVELTSKKEYSDIFHLIKHDIFLADAKNQLLYTREDLQGNDGLTKQAAVIRNAQREAQEMGKFNKERFDSLTINYGKYQGLTLYQALMNIRPRDVRSFFRYLDVAPNQYMGRKLDVGAELASWLYEGAAMSYADLADIFLEAKSPVEVDRFQNAYRSYITKDVLAYWKRLTTFYDQKQELDKALQLNQIAIRFYKIIGTDEETGLAYYYQADLQGEKKALDRALKANQQAIDWLEKAGNALYTFQALQQRGLIYEKHEQFAESAKAYAECLQFGKTKGDNSESYRKAFVEILQKLAVQAEQNKDFAKYLEYQQQKLKYVPPANTYNYGLTLAYLGFGSGQLGKQADALHYYLKALNVYDTTQLDQKPLAATVYKNIAAIYHNQRNYDSALVYYQPAVALNYSMMKESPSEATFNSFSRVSEAMANTFVDQGDLKNALTINQQLYELRKKMAKDYPSEKNKTEVNRILAKVGQLNAKLGNSGDAIKLFEDRVASHQKSGNKAGVAAAYWDMGNTFGENFKQYDKAIAAYQKSLSVYEELDDEAQKGRLFQYIGLNYFRKEVYDTALIYYEKALTIKKKIAEQSPSAETLNDLAWIYDHLADFHSKREQTDLAFDYYQKRLALHEKHGKPTEQGDAYWDIAIIYSDYKNQPAQAINYYKKALLIYKKEGIQRSVGTLYRNLGLNYNRLQDYQNALNNYKASHEIRKKLADALQDSTSQCELAQSLDGLADVHMRLGDYEAALKWQQERIPIYQHYDDLVGEADAYWDLGIIYGDKIKDYHKAIDHYHKAIIIYEESGDDGNLATLYNNIAINYAALSQFDKALEYNTKGLALHQKLLAKEPSDQHKREIAEDLADIGYRYFQKEAFEKADEQFSKSLQLIEAVVKSTAAREDKFTMAKVFGRIAENHLANGFHEQAMAAEEKRLKIYQELESQSDIAHAYFNMAYIRDAQAQYEEAIKLYEKSLNGYLVAQDTGNATIVLSNVGLSHWRLLEYDEAIKNHLKAIELAKSIDDHERIGSSYSYLADLYKQAGDPQKSLEAYNQSIKALNQANDKSELMTTYADLGELYRKNNDYQKSLDYFEQALELARLANARKKEGEMLFHVATVYHAKNDYKDAKYFYEKSLAIRKEINDKRGQAYCLAQLAGIKSANYDFDEATQLYNQAIALGQAIHDKDAVAHCRTGLAQMWVSQNKYNQAEQVYLSLLEHYTTTKNYTEQVNTTINIAQLYVSKGDFDKALELYEEAQFIAKKSANIDGVALANTGKAAVYRTLGDFDKALEVQLQSLKAFQESENPWGEATAYTHLGDVKKLQGAYQQAIRYYEQADSVYKRTADEYGTAMSSNHIGTIYYWQGNYEKALDYFQKSAAILDKLKVKDAFRAQIDGHIAAIHFMMAAYAKAEKRLLASLAEGRRFEDQRLVAINLIVMGKAKLKQKEYDEAEAYLDEAYKTTKVLKSKDLMAWATASLGALYYHTQDDVDAGKSLDESIALADASGINTYKWEALYYKGLISKKNKHFEQSKKQLMEALTMLEDLQSKFMDDEEVIHKFISSEEKMNLYESLVDVLIEKGEIELAQEVLDRSNRENLRTKFQQLRIRFPDESKMRVVQKESTLKAKLDHIDYELLKEKAKGELHLSKEKVKRLEAIKSLAKEKYTQFVNEAYHSHPNLSLHFSKNIHPIGSKTVTNKRLIPQGMTVISYLAGKDKLYIFASTADAISTRTVNVSQDDLSKKIAFMHHFGSNRIEGANTGVLGNHEEADLNANSFDGTQSAFKTTSEELYNWLIKPVEQEVLSSNKVGIIPAGQLHFLPFQLLGKKNDHGKFQFLVEQHTVFYLNALSMLEDFVSKQEPLNVLAFGNASQTRSASEKEINDIKVIYPNSKAVVRNQVTAQAVKQASEQYNALHFAIPSQFDYANFGQSYLTLGAGKQLGMEQIWEIEKLPHYQLVTLSNCEIVVSNQKAYASVNPAMGFIDAGANTVVSSLWPVDAKATALFMKYFYQNLATMEKVAALRKAQIQLGQQENYKHPHYWAPFILTGDWR